MTPIIPVSCEEIEHLPGRFSTHIEFIIPSLHREFIADFVPSRTAAAIRRANAVVAAELAGEDKASLVDLIDKMMRPAKRWDSAVLEEAELEEFKKDNGWAAPALEVAPALEAAPGPVRTSDGRYIVDPVAGTVEPVEEIPGAVVAVMPVWEKTDDGFLEFWPRSFDVAPGMEEALEVEIEAAAALLPELGQIVFGASPRDLKWDRDGHSVQLVDGGAFIRSA